MWQRGSEPRIVRSAARLAVFAACALFAACASPRPTSSLAFVTTVPGVVSPRILKQDVEGEWCFTENVVAVTLRPPWQVRLADAGRAVTKAIESVPGANILTDVTVRTRIEQYLLFQRVCSIVVGDAGSLR
jgi:hypothetical protein